jgi:ubiquinone/menaquinone biosynthesis C-methylase UbiE
MDQTKVSEWNESYQRAENFIFYPHENLVKFVNRHIRKRLGVTQFRDHIRPSRGGDLTALDFGCGIGAGVIMMHESGIRAHGVDISSVSIDVARQHARSKSLSIDDCFSVIQPNERLPFEDGRFDFFVACGVLDSMPFAAARRNMLELSRVTTQCAYVSLVAGDYTGSIGEQEVQTEHEQNTIQSYFNYDKCLALLAGTGFQIRSCELVTTEVHGSQSPKIGRYHLTLAKA